MTAQEPARTCKSTGLRLLQTAPLTGYHVAKTSFGAISAPPRVSAASYAMASNLLSEVTSSGLLPANDPAAWNRWDIFGETLYYGDSRRAAFGETLQAFQRPIGAVDPFVKTLTFFDDIETVDDLMVQIAGDWPEHSFIRSGSLPRSWREARNLFTLNGATGGWWIVVEHADSIASIEKNLGTHLADLGVGPNLTRAHLLSPDRLVTITIAEWLSRQVLDDGTLPLGVSYGSARGQGTNYADWMRGDAVADGPAERGSEPIRENDPDLLAAAKNYGLQVY